MADQAETYGSTCYSQIKLYIASCRNIHSVIAYYFLLCLLKHDCVNLEHSFIQGHLRGDVLSNYDFLDTLESTFLRYSACV